MNDDIKDIEAWFSRGNHLRETGRSRDAIFCYQKVIDIKPDTPEAFYNIGHTLKKSGRNHEALIYYQKALKINPELAEAYNGIGNIFLEEQRWKDALLSYKKAINISPEDAKFYYNMGSALVKQEKFQEGLNSFKQALRINPDLSPARWSYLLSLPMIYKKEDEIKYYRDRFKKGLDILIKETRLDNKNNKKIALSGLSSQENFFLTYQGLDDLEFKKKFGGLSCKIMAANYPQWSIPRKMPEPGANGKIRIGYLSSYMSSHTVGSFLYGWLSHSNRNEFELYCYHIGNILDEVTENIKQSCDFFYNIYNKLDKVAEQIINNNLHILVFTDIGMNPQATQIASLRLAPLQCKGWGHPITTGLPTIDYYLSSDLMESPKAQDYYSEQLIRLSNLALYCQELKLPQKIKQRKDFNIDDNAFVYLSSQSLFKYLPQYDFVFPAIARQVPNAKFVFIENQSQNATRVFQDRLALTFKEYALDYENYCIFQPRLGFDDFISLNLSSDVLLDTIMWSGGKTTLEGMGCDLPVVTLPGPFLRSRHAYAMQKMMGITETIAKDINNYIEIAVRLGRDKEYHGKLRMLIKDNKHKLYNDTAFMDDLEKFYKKQVFKKISGENSKVIQKATKEAKDHFLSEYCSDLSSLNSNEIYLNNLESLAINFPDVHQLLKQNQESFSYSPKTFATKNGLSNILFSLPDGNKIPFYLEDDIEYHADQIMSDWNLEQQDFLFCVGMGLGYIPLIYLKKYKSEPRIIIMEPEINIFNMAMQLVDLRALLNYKNLDIFVGYNYNMLKILNNYGFDLFFGKQRVLTHAASRIIFGKKFLDFESEIKAAIGTVRDTLYTTKEMGRDIFSNTIMNLPSFFSSISLGELRGRFSGFTAFCVAAGPSLDSAIDDLKQIGNRGLIIAIDSAVPALLQAGIVPHMVVTADVRKENIEKYRAYLDQLRNTVLVYGVESNPDNIRLFPGKRKLTISIDNPILNNWIGDLWNLDCNLPAMTTVSHGALFTALALGVNAIIMVGMDMAFPTGESHSKEAIHRYNFNNVNGLIKVEGTNGLPVYSNRPLTDYRVQIESVLSQSTISFINTSIAGASVKGVVNKSLKEIIDTLLNESNINEILDSIDWLSAISDTEIIPETKLLLQRIEAFKAECLFFEKMALEIIKYFSTCNSKQKMLGQLDTLKSFCKEFDEKNIFIIKILEGIRIGELKEFSLRRYSIKNSKSSQDFLKNLEDEIILQRDCFRSHYKAASYFFDLLNNFFIYFHRSNSFDKNKSKHIEDPVEMIEQARFFAGSNELMKSEALYREYLKKIPDDTEIAVELIDLFKSVELWGLALKEARALSQRNKVNLQAFKKLQEIKFDIKSILNDAGQALDKGDNNRVRIKLMEYRSIFPDDAKALILEKELRNKEKDTAASLVMNETDNLLSPGRLEELETKANALMSSGDFEKTAGIIEALLSRFPDKKAFYREKIGDMRAIQKDYRSALWNYKEALRSDKENKGLLEKIYQVKDQDEQLFTP